MAKTTGTTAKTAKKVFTKENLVTSLFSAVAFKDWAKTEAGKAAIEKISSKILGIGPGDEALFKKACTFLLDKILVLDRIAQVEERKDVLKKIENFLKELEAAGYSRWWFRNVLATMRKGDDAGENQAAITLAEIIQGDNFKEMVTLAGDDLVRKTYKKKISEGWEVIIDKSEGMNLLVDIRKFPEILSGKIEKIKENFIDYSWGFAKKFWIGFGILVLIVVIVEWLF